MRVDVALVPPTSVAPDTTCLVVDVLRATSVMAVLFGRGLRAGWLAGSIEEGRAIRAALGDRSGGIWLCGEANSLPPEGYDYGNSPLEYEGLDLPAEAVLATTNGTPALLVCAAAPLTMPAAPLNAAAVVRVAFEAGRDVLIVCSGRVDAATGRRVEGDDDTLAAGLLVERLVLLGARAGDEAVYALQQFEAARDHLGEVMRHTFHGASISAIGFGPDLERCCEPDVYDTVATLRMEDGRAVLRPLDRG